MSFRILRAASFRTLLEDLLVRIEDRCAADPFKPCWIATPTSTLATDLRIRLARRAGAGAILAVRILPLTRLVGSLISRFSGERPLVGSTLLDLLTREMVDRLGAGSKLGELNRIDRGFSLLMPIFRDLADSGLNPRKVRLLLEDEEAGELSRMGRETVNFYATWAETVEELGIPWQPFLHARLNDWLDEAPEDWVTESMSAEPGQQPELFIYGFYDFTDLNLGTIGALSRKIPVEVLLPGELEPGRQTGKPVFHFTDRVLDEILARRPSAIVEGIGSGDETSTRFFLGTFPEGLIGPRPAFLSYCRASGIEAEALAAAVQTQTWLDASLDLQPHEILIAAPGADRYQFPLQRVFSEFGLPLTVLDVEFAQSLETRPLNMLERLWRESASSEWLLAYLRDYPEISKRKGIDLDAFEWKLRELRLHGGAAWSRLGQQLEVAAENVESISGAFSENERGLIIEIEELWANRQGIAAELSAEEALRWMERLRSWLPDPSLLDRAAEDIREFTRLLPEAILNRQTLFAMFLEDASVSSQSGSPSQPGVRLISLMRARGLVARKVILLGMAAGRFPQSAQEDPLLSDADRLQLFRAASALGHRFPVKSHMIQEMALLFFLTNAGCESLHWVIPEADENGKAVAPSPWLSRYLNAWAQGDAQPDPAGSAGRHTLSRVPRSPVEQADWLLRLDPQTGGFLAPAYGACLQRAFSRLRLGEEYDYLVGAMGRRETEDRWNGSIDTASLGQLSSKDRFSVSELENLAKCPFRFWASALARIEGIQPLTWEGELSPLDRGQLVHHCLDWLVRTCLAGHRRFAEMPELLTEAIREGGFLDREVRGLLLFLPPVFRKNALREIEELIQAYLRTVSDRLGTDTVPIQSEVKIRRPFPGLDGRQVSGVLDRIDRRGDAVWIVDYKTSRSPFRGKPEEFSLLQIGFISQPILYPWLCQEIECGGRPAGFSFVYLREKPPREVELREIPAGEAFLSQLAVFLKAGAYPLLSSKSYEDLGLKDAAPCLSCELASLCRRFDRGAEARGIRLLKTVAPARYRQLKQVAGGDHASE